MCLAYSNSMGISKTTRQSSQVVSAEHVFLTHFPMHNSFMSTPGLRNKPKRWLLAALGVIYASQCHAEATPNEIAIATKVVAAKAALTTGQAEKAAELYEQAAAMGESADAEIGLVRAYLQSGEFRKAVSFANLVAAEHADISETAALLSYIEDREGQTAPALAKLSTELQKHPDDVALFAANMEILIDRLALPQAIQQLDAWISHNPPQGDIYRLRARAALAAGNRDDVLTWRRKAADAYQTAGETQATQTLRNWLAKQVGNQQTAESVNSTVIASQAPQEKQPLSNWPAPYQEAFPLDDKVSVKSGNGFVIDAGRHVVTYASLLVKAGETVWVRNGLGKIRQAKLEKLLPEQGLALLKLETPYAKAWSLPMQALNVPDTVHNCFLLGYSISDELETSYPIISPGVVVRPAVGIGNLMQITASLGAENSGSAVFDVEGKLIGMTLGKQEPLKDLANRETVLGKGNFALRAEALQNLLPNAFKPQKPRTQSKPLTAKVIPSIEDLYEKLLPLVVTIVVPNK